MILVAPLALFVKFFGPISDQFLQSCHLMDPLPSATPPRPIVTPCIKVCVVDGASSLCLGCLRTLSEIGGWSGLDDAERARIMAELPGRRSRVDPALLGD